MSVVQGLYDSKLLKWFSNSKNCPILYSPSEAALFKNAFEGGGYSQKQIIKRHGRKIAGAVGYKNRKERIQGPRGGRKERPTRTRIEFAIHADGSILARIEVQWVKDGRGWKWPWRLQAVLKPATGDNVLALVQAWQELGYITRIEKGKWVEAEQAIAMLKEYMGDSD